MWTGPSCRTSGFGPGRPAGRRRPGVAARSVRCGVAVRAVLFDWRGTLVTSPGPHEVVREALRRSGRPAAQADVDAVVAAVDLANGPDDRLDAPGMDCDAQLHRRLSLEVFRDAGLDPDVAQALYALDAEPAANPFAADARDVLQAVRSRGTAVALVSDIHFDVRPLFDAAGLGGLVDVFTLSFEQGVQKPDPRMFTRPLDALGVDPGDALMVGDRSRPDGAAVEAGLTTLLLPPLARVDDRRLHQVVALCDARAGRD